MMGIIRERERESNKFYDHYSQTTHVWKDDDKKFVLPMMQALATKPNCQLDHRLKSTHSWEITDPQSR